MKLDAKITFQLTPEEKETIKILAEKDGRTSSSLIRHLIQQYIKEQKNENQNHLY